MDGLIQDRKYASQATRQSFAEGLTSIGKVQMLEAIKIRIGQVFRNVTND